MVSKIPAKPRVGSGMLVPKKCQHLHTRMTTRVRFNKFSGYIPVRRGLATLGRKTGSTPKRKLFECFPHHSNSNPKNTSVRAQVQTVKELCPRMIKKQNYGTYLPFDRLFLALGQLRRSERAFRRPSGAGEAGGRRAARSSRHMARTWPKRGWGVGGGGGVVVVMDSLNGSKQADRSELLRWTLARSNHERKPCLLVVDKQ